MTGLKVLLSDFDVCHILQSCALDKRVVSKCPWDSKFIYVCTKLDLALPKVKQEIIWHFEETSIFWILCNLFTIFCKVKSSLPASEWCILSSNTKHKGQTSFTQSTKLNFQPRIESIKWVVKKRRALPFLQFHFLYAIKVHLNQEITKGLY